MIGHETFCSPISRWIIILLFCCWTWNRPCPPSSAVMALATTTKTTNRHVVRIPRDSFQADIHYRHDVSEEFLETPVLVTGVLEPWECEGICQEIMAVSDTLPVTVQRKQRWRPNDNDSEYDSVSSTAAETTTKATTSFYDCTLQQGIDAIMDSHHDDTRFIFQEGLLESHPLLSTGLVLPRIKQVQEALFHDKDWLSYLPTVPSTCVVIAGEGATSTLHRDPMEWTGISICLEGTKVWRFLAPSPNVTTIDTMLNSYRLQSIAWEEDEDIPISAGWQSDDYSLYDKRINDGSIPSAQSLDQITNVTDKWRLIDSIATCTTKLQPHLPPLHVPTTPSVLWTAVQKPGDLLVIPAHWWHQTYALEPSIAIASQRSGTIRDAPRLMKHILQTTGLGHSNERILQKGLEMTTFTDESAKDSMDQLFAELAASLKK